MYISYVIDIYSTIAVQHDLTYELLYVVASQHYIDEVLPGAIGWPYVWQVFRPPAPPLRYVLESQVPVLRAACISEKGPKRGLIYKTGPLYPVSNGIN